MDSPRDTAAWLRVLKVRDPGTRARLGEIADYLEKSQDTALGEASMEDLFREVSNRTFMAVLAMVSPLNGEERLTIFHSGSQIGCIGVAAAAHTYMLRKLRRMDGATWDGE